MNKSIGPITTNQSSVWRYRKGGNCSAPCQGYDTENRSRLKTYYHKHTVGVRTPRFHELKRAGALIPATDFYQAECEVTENNWSFNIQKSGCASGCSEEASETGAYENGPYITEAFLNTCPLVTVSPVNAMNALASNIMSKEFDALTWTTELRSTIGLFEKVANRVRGIVNKKPPTASWQEPWLEWRYGWRLLYYDARNLVKAVNNLNKSVQRIRAGNRSFHTDSTTIRTTTSANAFWGYDVRVKDVTWKLNQSCGLVADIDLNVFRVNPVLTAWELIPYSFIVDWFIPVGDYISTWELLLRARGNVVAWTGIKIECTMTEQRTGTPTGIYYGGNSGTISSTGSLVKRTPYTIGELPKFQAGLNFDRMRDILALLKSRIPHR